MTLADGAKGYCNWTLSSVACHLITVPFFLSCLCGVSHIYHVCTGVHVFSIQVWSSWLHLFLLVMRFWMVCEVSTGQGTICCICNMWFSNLTLCSPLTQQQINHQEAGRQNHAAGDGNEGCLRVFQCGRASWKQEGLGWKSWSII